MRRHDSSARHRSWDTAKFEAKVRAEWMDEATAAAWRKWHDKSVRFRQEFTDALLAVARLAPQMLEIARDDARRAGLGNLSFEVVMRTRFPARGIDARVHRRGREVTGLSRPGRRADAQPARRCRRPC
jgi:hypothetical protein